MCLDGGLCLVVGAAAVAWGLSRLRRKTDTPDDRCKAYEAVSRYAAHAADQNWKVLKEAGAPEPDDVSVPFTARKDGIEAVVFHWDDRSFWSMTDGDFNWWYWDSGNAPTQHTDVWNHRTTGILDSYQAKEIVACMT